MNVTTDAEDFTKIQVNLVRRTRTLIPISICGTKVEIFIVIAMKISNSFAVFTVMKVLVNTQMFEYSNMQGYPIYHTVTLRSSNKVPHDKLYKISRKIS